MTFINIILIIAIFTNINTSSSFILSKNVYKLPYGLGLRNQRNIKKSPTFRMNLNNINENNDDNILNKNNKNTDKKLLKIKDSIQKYIEKKNNVEDQRIKDSFIPNKGIIKKVDFDKVFLNISNIQKIYLSSNNDRIIIELINNVRNVYYMKDKNDFDKIKQLIKLIPNKHKIIIISDYHNMMDDMYGPLYCEK